MSENGTYKKLAALAVFRELYSKNKDVYYIISEFARERIISKSLHTFTYTEITNEINNEYSFDLPSYIVKTSLKRLEFVKKDFREYYTKENFDKGLNLKDKEIENQKNNQIIVAELCKFIANKYGKNLTTTEEREITKSFCNFILDNTSIDKYSDSICAYILENQSNSETSEKLRKIKEGLLLYSGIVFTDPSKIGSWKKELYIFLDIEILFHLAGYNGEVFKKNATDLLNFTNEINNKARKNMIKLRYFKEIMKEIDKFFYVAELIVEGKHGHRANSIAMGNIVNGCRDKSDILIKRSDFYTELKKNSILLDDKNDYFEETNHKYNIISPEISTKLQEKYTCDDLQKNLRYLNYINIQRRNKNKENFENVKYVFLTGNSLTLRLSKDNLLLKKGEQVKAIDLESLINKFWFKLNKGFGKKEFPEIFSVSTKAQIVLSKHLNDRVIRNYEEVEEEYRKGNITEEHLSARLIDLKQKVKMPEEINKENVDVVLENINKDSLQNFREEQEHFKQKARKNEELLHINKLLYELEIKKERLKVKLKDKNERMDEQRTIKNNLDNKYFKMVKIYKVLIIIVCFLFIISTFLLKYKFELDWIFSLIPNIVPPVLFFLHFIIKEKTFNFRKVLNSLKIKLKSRIYKKYMFNPDKYELLSEKIKQLNNELQYLEKSEI